MTAGNRTVKRLLLHEWKCVVLDDLGLTTQKSRRVRCDMTVHQIMTKSPKSCSPAMNLAQATESLWSAGCGALPVVNADRKVIGVVTDRDICIALGTRNQRAAEVTVGQVMSGKLYSCHPDDDIHVALNAMRAHKVRRLPVVGDGGKLEGMLCASDVLLCARHDDGSAPELSYENIVSTLRGIYCHCPPVCS
jgi:CBS domain-containing protein